MGRRKRNKGGKQGRETREGWGEQRKGNKGGMGRTEGGKKGGRVEERKLGKREEVGQDDIR